MKKTICRGCKEEIITKKERYVHVEDYNCEVKETENYWHLKCFAKAMNRDLTEMEKQTFSLLKNAQGLFARVNKAFPKQEEEFVI